MNQIVVDLSSEDENGEQVNYSDLFDGVSETLDEKPKNSNLLNPMVENEDGDDDCVILDCDPMAKETAIDTCETDEVLVVGQKGEIACRDFPHPRHACAKYSFESTSHQHYCEMCHCYVCDTRAPCPYWFMGLSTIDHCHANDKEQIWKTRRELYRTVGMPPRPVSKPSLTIAQSQQVSRYQSVLLPQNSASPVTQFRVRACSTSTRDPNLCNRPGNGTEQSKSYTQNPGSQSCTVQSLPNYKSPQAVYSNPYPWTQSLSKGVYRHNTPKALQSTHYAPPAVSQGNPQQTVTGYISTVPESQSKGYAKQFNRNMYSANVQTIAVPSQTLNLPVNQQQQQQLGRSNAKVLSEFEEWLLNDSLDDSTFTSDYENFFND